MGYYLWFLWAEDELSRPIGVIAFAFDSIEKDIWIELAYTDPEHRRKGVYRALFSRLVEGATKRGVRLIESGIHEQNVSAGLEQRQSRRF